MKTVGTVGKDLGKGVAKKVVVGVLSKIALEAIGFGTGIDVEDFGVGTYEE